jgi:hypothetical protein
MKKQIIILENLEVIRSNGTNMGHVTYDKTWENYRFYPNEDYYVGFTKEDLKLIAKEMEKIK